MHTEILLATNNQDKLLELSALLSFLPVTLHNLAEFPLLPATIEDMDTISGNAMKKALESAEHSGLLCLADDTGLFIEALDNAPGVYTARFAGEICSYSDNRQKALKLMEGITNRKATFKTAVALAAPDGIIAVVEGKVVGDIALKELGDSGFGYDSIFAVNGVTYAQMDWETKNSCSHRAEAIKAILPILQKITTQIDH
ncbi:MAG: non-canonical purine NTP pyrophosphatase [Candidatus Cloacimonetes bacterium]|nr:non-canonical purine NTP pyrophosphatase [Candidatus Cloacimonadota bacterium]